MLVQKCCLTQLEVNFVTFPGLQNSLRSCHGFGRIEWVPLAPGFTSWGYPDISGSVSEDHMEQLLTTIPRTQISINQCESHGSKTLLSALVSELTFIRTLDFRTIDQRMFAHQNCFVLRKKTMVLSKKYHFFIHSVYILVMVVRVLKKG